MASAMRKMAVYLGLVEDDHRYDDQYQDEYGAEEYEEYGAEFIDQGDSRDVMPRAEAGLEPASRLPEREPVVQMQTTDLARITTLHPRTYNEARTIGEHFREGTPVIIRSIDRVTNKVFLLSPANVEVAAEDKARIAERGFFNQS